jgi:hypothetical protein
MSLLRFRAFGMVTIVVGMAAVAAACGDGGAQGPGPQTPGTATTPTPGSAAPSAAPAPSGSASGAASNATTTKPPVSGAPMKAIAVSAMEADLKEIGLDPRALPPLNKLEPEKLRKVMKKFTKALGVQCSHCHDTKDFHAATPNKKIATHMWNDFTRSLKLNDGGVLFCDSCHGGHATFLDRSSIPTLAEWMKQNYEAKLSRVDKKDHSCETCHGDPFEGKILTKLWK